MMHVALYCIKTKSKRQNYNQTGIFSQKDLRDLVLDPRSVTIHSIDHIKTVNTHTYFYILKITVCAKTEPVKKGGWGMGEGQTRGKQL